MQCIWSYIVEEVSSDVLTIWRWFSIKALWGMSVQFISFFLCRLISLYVSSTRLFSMVKRVDGITFLWINMITPEAVVHRCSVKKMFLEISQNSQGNTCARVTCATSCEIWKILRTPNFIELLKIMHAHCVNTFSSLFQSIIYFYTTRKR